MNYVHMMSVKNNRNAMFFCKQTRRKLSTLVVVGRTTLGESKLRVALNRFFLGPGAMPRGSLRLFRPCGQDVSFQRCFTPEVAQVPKASQFFLHSCCSRRNQHVRRIQNQLQKARTDPEADWRKISSSVEWTGKIATGRGRARRVMHVKVKM